MTLPRSSAVGSTSCRRVFDYPQHLARFEEVEEAQNDPDFWNDPAKGQALVADMKVARVVVDPIRKLAGYLEEVDVLAEMGAEAGEDEVLDDIQAALGAVRTLLRRSAGAPT